MPKRIVILGAGFGGLQAAIELDKLVGHDPDVEITLVNEQNYFLFTPLLPQIASSYINPRHIVQPVRDIRGRRRFRFRRDTIEAIDIYKHEVRLGSGTLQYDILIVALGSRTDYFNVPGAREHTLDFKSLEDAVALRERVLDLCEHADHTADAALRGRMLTFIVVGGGYTGVELITDLRDLLLEYVARNYRGIPRRDIQLILLEATDEILRGVHPSLARHSEKRLRREGIKVRTGARVTRCTEGSVEINGEEIIRAETIVWAAGVRAHELVEALPGPHDKIGRCEVNEFLQLAKHPEVFIVGDSAAAVTAPEAPRVAPVAIDHGRIAATNAAALLGVGAMRSYEYVSMGMLVTLGMNYAVVSIGGLKLRGYLAWLFWNAVHLFKLVGFKKQVQVALDWLLAEIFPRDAAIVRRQKNCRFCAPPQSEEARK